MGKRAVRHTITSVHTCSALAHSRKLSFSLSHSHTHMHAYTQTHAISPLSIKYQHTPSLGYRPVDVHTHTHFSCINVTKTKYSFCNPNMSSLIKSFLSIPYSQTHPSPPSTVRSRHAHGNAIVLVSCSPPTANFMWRKVTIIDPPSLPRTYIKF